MKQIQIEQGYFALTPTHQLVIPELTITQGESWAIVGSNGSGKSLFAKALANELALTQGHIVQQFQSVTRLSFEQLQSLIEEEWQRNNHDEIAPDDVDTGRTTQQIILEHVANNAENQAHCQQLAQQFGIAHLLDRRFKYLSSGETRKTLLCQALISQPDLLILDEPFDGLDIDSRQSLSELLAQLADSGLTVVLIVNRFSEIPDFISHVGILEHCQLVQTGEKAVLLDENKLIEHFTYLEQLTHYSLPDADSDDLPVLADDQPLIILKDGYVHYNDRPIIKGLNWQVDMHQHWQICGPNGAGKSTLLSLITGDHPQGYSNHLILFGKQRGSGETIWDIKRHIGYVSNALHLDYRVNTSIRNVILSGYFDSIGVYQSVSDKQLELANQWLALLNLTEHANTPFRSLSWGQQRLILIVRALVKHPTLLILDEPLQGLDAINRQIVRRWIDILIQQGTTQLLFVSHHAEDAPDCITHRLSFVSNNAGYTYQITVCDQQIALN